MAVLASSARSIIAAMEEVGAKRLITVSGSMVDDTGDRVLLRYLGKPLARRILKDVYTDMRRAEGEIHASHLERGRVRDAGSVFCSRRRTVPGARQMDHAGIGAPKFDLDAPFSTSHTRGAFRIGPPHLVLRAGGDHDPCVLAFREGKGPIFWAHNLDLPIIGCRASQLAFDVESHPVGKSAVTVRTRGNLQLSHESTAEDENIGLRSGPGGSGHGWHKSETRTREYTESSPSEPTTVPPGHLSPVHADVSFPRPGGVGLRASRDADMSDSELIVLGAVRILPSTVVCTDGQQAPCCLGWASRAGTPVALADRSIGSRKELLRGHRNIFGVAGFDRREPGRVPHILEAGPSALGVR
jgi:hypothetical protein